MRVTDRGGATRPRGMDRGVSHCTAVSRTVMRQLSAIVSLAALCGVSAFAQNIQIAD
jgi:hypothetical protein